MAKEKELEMARKAGENAARTEPPERRHPDSCPFEVGSEERTAWLLSFAEQVDAAPEPVTLRQDISDAISVNDAAVEA